MDESLPGLVRREAGHLAMGSSQLDTSHITHTGAGRHREEVPRQNEGVTKLPTVGVVQRR